MHLTFHAQVRLFVLLLLLVLAIEVLLGALSSMVLVSMISGFVGSIVLVLPALRLELARHSRQRLDDLDLPTDLEDLRAILRVEIDRRLTVWKPLGLIILYVGIALLAASFFLGLINELTKP